MDDIEHRSTVNHGSQIVKQDSKRLDDPPIVEDLKNVL
jgi:hypothetical protein